MRAVAELAEELRSEPSLEPPDPHDAVEIHEAGAPGLLRGLPGAGNFPPGVPMPGPGGGAAGPARTPVQPRGLLGVGEFPIGVPPPGPGWEKNFVSELIILVN